jgi:hypothetical protein
MLRPRSEYALAEDPLVELGSVVPFLRSCQENAVRYPVSRPSNPSEQIGLLLPPCFGQGDQPEECLAQFGECVGGDAVQLLDRASLDGREAGGMKTLDALVAHLAQAREEDDH